MPAKYFEIPKDNVEAMVALVCDIPDTWGWADGKLCAPTGLVVAENTGIRLSRFHGIHPTIISGNQNQYDMFFPFFSLFVEMKPPAFITFVEAGYNKKEISLELVRAFLKNFLHKGYRGHITLFKDCHHDNKHQNPARCSIIFEQWKGGPLMDFEEGEQPARIKIEWEPKFGGTQDDVEPFLSVCNTYSLREYEPVPGVMF